MRNMATATAWSTKIMDWVGDGVEVQSYGGGGGDWLIKQTRIKQGGLLASFFLTTLQTGNIFHLTAREFDIPV